MTKSCGDGELDVKLWDKTNLEVERGWLAGPLDWSSPTVSRRFPLSQTDKVRPIDDLSQSQVNSTVTSFEQATVDGPDVICALALFLMKQLADNGKETELVGRSLDLASAYRQLSISDHSLKFILLPLHFQPVGEDSGIVSADCFAVRFTYRGQRFYTMCQIFTMGGGGVSEAAHLMLC